MTDDEKSELIAGKWELEELSSKECLNDPYVEARHQNYNANQWVDGFDALAIHHFGQIKYAEGQAQMKSQRVEDLLDEIEAGEYQYDCDADMCGKGYVCAECTKLIVAGRVRDALAARHDRQERGNDDE